MRNALLISLIALITGCAATSEGTLEPRPDLTTIKPGELQIQIQSKAADIYATDAKTRYSVEGVASTIGGVEAIDMMLVLDRSLSLKKSDPENYRTSGAIGLIESFSKKSNTKIGVVAFDDNSELKQPLTTNRRDVVQALKGMKRSGGTNIAAGIQAALNELETNGRAGSSRVIMLFTDGQSNRTKALAAARDAQSQRVAIQTMLLGSNTKGALVLEEIALGTGGSFVQVTDPALLPEAFLNMRTTGVEKVMLSINGSVPVPAKLNGGSFSGQVPLKVGENRIVASATSIDDQTEESVLNVTVHDASCAALEITAVKDGQPALSLNERAVEIVVDASNSMWGQLQGKAKMAVAKEILHDASHWLPNDLNLALRAYGNESPTIDNDCTDSSLLVPFGEENREPIREAISELRPKGQTPIAYALSQAAADFESQDTERALVLVTDGIESCGGDPVAIAKELREQNIKIHLIGFGLNNAADEDAISLQAVADASGGRFLTASSAEELQEALTETVGTPFQVLRGDTVVADGSLGSNEPIMLPQGDYRVRLESLPPHEVDVSLAAMEQLTVTLEKDAGEVSHSQDVDKLQRTSCRDLLTKMKNADDADRSMPLAKAGRELRRSAAWK